MPRKPATIEALQSAIETIIAKRAIEAAQMQYDRKVWINAVSTARDAYKRVPVEGTVENYHRAVEIALNAACEAHNDTDGEYTNGTGAIGDVCFDISALLVDDQDD